MAKNTENDKLHKLFGQYEELIFSASNNIETKSLYGIQNTFYKQLDYAVKKTAQGLKPVVDLIVNPFDSEIKPSSIDALKRFGAINDSASVKISTYVQIVSNLTQSANHLKSDINSFIKEREGDKKAITIMDLKDFVKEKLLDGSATSVQYSNGAQMSVENYAKMLARTTKIETGNVSMLLHALDMGNDLVECSVVDNTCPLCAMLQGRIYSISGNSTEFPSLYDKCFKNGYSIIHPNCRHQFFPYNKNFHTPEENKKLIADSNRPFTLENQQTQRMAENYAKGQQLNRQYNRELVEYMNMRQVLGDDMPYKSLGAFRRAVRMDKPSETLLNARKSMRTELSKIKVEPKSEIDFIDALIEKNLSREELYYKVVQRYITKIDDTYIVPKAKYSIMSLINLTTRIRGINKIKKIENLNDFFIFSNHIGIEPTKHRQYKQKIEDGSFTKEDEQFLLEIGKNTVNELKASVEEGTTEYKNYKVLSSKLKEIKEQENLVVSQSPYGASYYLRKEGEAITWGEKPDGSYRLADHWNFTSRGQKHCLSDGEDNEIYIAKYSKKDGMYHKLKI